MPVRGLIDSNGERIKLEDAIAGHGTFPWPLPLTKAICRGYRAEDHYGSDDVLSATTLIGPPQITQLTKRYNLWVHPLDSLWATYGTLMHTILEGDADEGAFTEEKMTMNFEGQMIAGTVDRFVPSIEEGQDWKITSAYAVKQMVKDGVEIAKPEYYWQAQIYKYLLWKVHNLEAQDWNLILICRDYNARRHSALFDPVVVVPVPLRPILEIEAYIRERVILHQAAALADDAGLPDCTDAERWYGRRCESYCSVSKHCVQLNPELGMEPALD